MNFILKSILIFLGTVFVILGIIGIFLPLLPTTPFLLLAASCYFKGSRYLYTRLMETRTLGSYIKNYQTGTGLPLKVKTIIITVLWLTILCSLLSLQHHPYIMAALLIVAIGVTCHIISLKTLDRNN